LSTTSFQLRGGHVLAALLLFFAAIIAINVAFAIAAVRSFPGEDERRSYTQGLRYNDVLAERRAQAALGWRAHAEFSSTSSGARLIVRLDDHEAAPIAGAVVTGVLRWPPQESGDRPLTFISQGEGNYAADVGALAPGRWELRGRAEDESGNTLDFQAELTWPSTP
jgi:nitrogen fixation protein FixH